jgi:hypothetical protein
MQRVNASPKSTRVDSGVEARRSLSQYAVSGIVAGRALTH